MPTTRMLGGGASFPARVDSDPLLVQDAGDNSSFRQRGVTRINAMISLPIETREISSFFGAAMRMGIDGPEVDGDRPEGLTLDSRDLRPLIGTRSGGLFNRRVAALMHRVNMLAHAARRYASEILQDWLAGFNRCPSPHVQPKARLASKLCTRVGWETEQPDFALLET